jgi:hypothetical protein
MHFELFEGRTSIKESGDVPQVTAERFLASGQHLGSGCRTYFNAGTSEGPGTPGQAGWEEDSSEERASAAERALSWRGSASMSARWATPVSVLPDIRCSGNPADRQTADRALRQSAVRVRLWPVAQRPRQDRSEHAPKFAVGSPRFPPPLPIAAFLH